MNTFWLFCEKFEVRRSYKKVYILLLFQNLYLPPIMLDSGMCDNDRNSYITTLLCGFFVNMLLLEAGDFAPTTI